MPLSRRDLSIGLRRAAVVVLRLGWAAFWLLTAAYGIVSSSPFAFEMFIEPGLMPWVNEFVARHHLWFFSAHAAVVLSLLIDPDMRVAAGRPGTVARTLGTVYALAPALLGSHFLNAPYLASLNGDSRGIAVALLALVPLIWLGVIDHLVLRIQWQTHRRDAAAFEHQLVLATLLAAALLWTTHFGRAIASGLYAAGMPGVVLVGAWSIGLILSPMLAVAASFIVIRRVSSFTLQQARYEYALTGCLLSVAAGAYLATIVLPTLSLPDSPALAVSAVAGVAIVLTWSGLVRRSAQARRGTEEPLRVMFVSPRSKWVAVAALIMLPFGAARGLQFVEQLDWDFVAQRSLVCLEGCLAFGLSLGLARPLHFGKSSQLLAASTVASLLAATATPGLAAFLAARTSNAALQPAVLFEELITTQPGFRAVARGLLDGPGQDPDYYQYLQTSGSPGTKVTIPAVQLTQTLEPASERPPAIFVFVIDSLRRDYLSPYNRAVTFTPRVHAFAEESFVFRNAFTRHGGTELSVPSLWSGALVVRRVRAPGFERMNAIEKLLNANNYRVAINDFTVAPLLRSETGATVIDAGIPSVQTDLCSNLEALSAHVQATRADPRPLFAYLSPMNVHLLNTRRGTSPLPGAILERYQGFYEPYASRLERIDTCFGYFIDYLKRNGLFDSSVVILTSDHGDSLGEDGYWGHAYWLFPEGIRVPLIIKLPDRLRDRVTTDLARVAFLTDVAPTLYALLGYRLSDMGSLFGDPLFVDRASAPASRRRDSFLITSSYASTYGVLRRNGTFLFISDLHERREFAFDLSKEGRRKLVTGEDLRRLSRQIIRTQIGEAASFYATAPAMSDSGVSPRNHNADHTLP